MNWKLHSEEITFINAYKKNIVMNAKYVLREYVMKNRDLPSSSSRMM